jgi:hypothetical protein
MRLTKATVKQNLQKLGLTFKQTGDGDFRINFRGEGEATAYYARDLGDALAAGQRMAGAGGLRDSPSFGFHIDEERDVLALAHTISFEQYSDSEVL